MAPHRQRYFADLGLRAMIATFFACFLTACVTGILL
ncbi:hypothetical protein [Myxosarcina sp. GI1(2024)]